MTFNTRHPTTTPAHHRSTTLYSLTLLVALAAGGCASVGAPDRSSTLPAFEQLSLQNDGTRAWRSQDATAVKTVHIDPQAIAFGTGVKLDDAQRQVLRDRLSQALSAQFNAAGVRVARTHGEGADAMAVRATITSVDLANPVLNAVTTVLLFAPVSRGGLSVEIEGLGGPGSPGSPGSVGGPAGTVGTVGTAGQRVAALAFSGTAGVNNVGSAFSGIGHAALQADIAASKFVSLVTGVQPQVTAKTHAQGEPQP